MRHWIIAAALALAACTDALHAQSATGIDVSQQPLFTVSAEPPLNMLVIGRDHKLYYEAYNDASDLDGDRVIDMGYKPEQIEYFGYFDSHRCYTYTGDRFVSSAVSASKRCSGSWSGDFLNYVTTSRIDAIRKVLYGGYRAVDTANETVLERSHIPQDAHTWAKQYVSPEVDGYDIGDYTPLAKPGRGLRHLFANVTLIGDEPWGPRLRVLTDTIYPPWQWVSIERPVAADNCVVGWNGPRCDGTNGARLTDFKVRVRVCDAGNPEAFCKRYPNGKFKPVGLLHDYGESGEMMFGLLTGSYAKNTEGGVLRSNMARFDREVDADTGRFRSDVKDGIVYTIDHLRTIDFSPWGFFYACGWITTRPVNDGECSMWGNPVAEMMYETLRYFGGAKKPRPEFETPNGASDGNAPLSLAKPDWKPPYVERPQGGGFAQCAAPVMTVVSDINPSYDFSLPGSTWRSLSGSGDPGSLAGLNVSAEVDAIWAADGSSRRAFIGESAGLVDGAPTPKVVSNLSTVRGLAPEEPTKQGTYYSAGVARFGATHAIGGDKPVRTYVVALASPLPRIDFPVGSGRISLVPFAKSVEGGGIDANGAFQPTNQIVDFYVQRIANTDPSGSDLNLAVNGGRPYAEFRINFEDVEQGADHDMDLIVLYTLRATENGQLDVQLATEYAFGSMLQHAGYVISGSNRDGVYLDVCDLRDNGTNDGTRASCHGQTRYRLNTPPGRPAGWCADNLGSAECAGLPPTAVRRFSPGSTDGATLLNGPLWFAAKYGLPGGMADGDSDGQPDNYFLVTNALGLKEQLRRAFDTIVADTRPSASVATSTARFIPGATLGYQVSFKSDDWTGDVQAFRLRDNGTMGAQVWSANAKLPTPGERAIFSARRRSGGDGFEGVEFTPRALGDDATAQVFGSLNPARYDVDGLFAFLRGDQTREEPAGPYRKRGSRIGDVLNSTPAVTAKISYGYGQLPARIGGVDTGAASYRAFVDAKSASPVLFVGANDGMLHAFDGSESATGGRELFAYVPQAVLGKLGTLARPGYVHSYFVDGTPTIGDAYLRRGWRTVLLESTGAGARSVFALDVTTPRSFSATDVMWEFNDRIDADMGQFVGQASMGLAPDGRWVAAFGNGYNSEHHRAILFVRDLAGGGAVAKIDTGAGSTAMPNGLSTATMVDGDGDGAADTIYAGDYRGNLWKFEYDHGWRIALGGRPLFTAADADGHRQSITSGVYTVENPVGGTMVMFGTGRYLGAADADANRVEPDGKPLVDTIYAIWDKGDGTRIDIAGGSRDDQLQRQAITGYTNGYRQSTRNPVNFRTGDNPHGKMGWYLDLSLRAGSQNVLRGERVIAAPTVILGTLLVGTFRPLGNTCEPGGLNAIMELDALTGAASYTEVPPPGGYTGGGPPPATGGTDIGNGPPQGSPNPIVYAPPPPIIPEIGCQPGEPGCGELPPVSEAGECRWTLPNPANKPVQAPMPCGRVAWRQLR